MIGRSVVIVPNHSKSTKETGTFYRFNLIK